MSLPLAGIGRVERRGLRRIEVSLTRTIYRGPFNTPACPAQQPQHNLEWIQHPLKHPHCSIYSVTGLMSTAYVE